MPKRTESPTRRDAADDHPHQLACRAPCRRTRGTSSTTPRRSLRTTEPRCPHPSSQDVCSGRPRSCCWQARSSRPRCSRARRRMAVRWHSSRCCSCSRSSASGSRVETSDGVLSASLGAMVLAMGLLGPAPAAACGIAAMVMHSAARRAAHGAVAEQPLHVRGGPVRRRAGGAGAGEPRRRCAQPAPGAAA